MKIRVTHSFVRTGDVCPSYKVGKQETASTAPPPRRNKNNDDTSLTFFLPPSSVTIAIASSTISLIEMMAESGSGLSSSMMNESNNDDEGPVSVLSLVQNYDWSNALTRIQQFPQECQQIGHRGRTPLHVACDRDAPPEIIRALVQAYPQACLFVGTTGMNPLHIACSSDHASPEVIQTLLVAATEVSAAAHLKLNLAQTMASRKDVDHDTPLHSACRCGAPLAVLRLLMLVYPEAVHQRDYEGLTPLLRLWVRECVLLGDDTIQGVQGPEGLTGELGDAWKKTMMLLYCAYVGSIKPLEEQHQQLQGAAAPVATSRNVSFWPMHAMAAIDCPRRVVKIAATKIHRDQLLQKDENGMTPLLIACKAPIYKFQDIAYDGADLEDKLEDHLYNSDEGNNNDDANMISADERESTFTLPSVIEILLQAEPAAARIADPSGKLPLQLAMESGRTAAQGVEALQAATTAEGATLEQNLEANLKIVAEGDSK
jgi:ankyrin repeat protein